MPSAWAAAKAPRTMRSHSSLYGSWCWGNLVRVFFSVSFWVHSQSARMAFWGSSTICSPSSMALARTTSSSALRSGTLPISLRYIRTGSSMPTMSAASASSSSLVGSSCSSGSSLAGGSSQGCRSFSATATSTPSSAARPSLLRGLVIVVRVLARSAHLVVDVAALAALEDGFDEQLVGGVCGGHGCPPVAVGVACGGVCRRWDSKVVSRVWRSSARRCRWSVEDVLLQPVAGGGVARRLRPPTAPPA